MPPLYDRRDFDQFSRHLRGSYEDALGDDWRCCAAALLLTACVVAPGQVEPYSYSPSYCAGCWYGEWGGRTGLHQGGDRPWERPHTEADHHGNNEGSDVRHEGHR